MAVRASPQFQEDWVVITMEHSELEVRLEVQVRRAVAAVAEKAVTAHLIAVRVKAVLAVAGAAAVAAVMTPVPEGPLGLVETPDMPYVSLAEH